MLIIGYTPLYKPKFQITDTDISKLLEDWGKFEAPYVKGVLWIKKDDDINAFLIIDKAKAVYSHLMEWCESKYLDWFVYGFKKFDTGYCICIHPKIDMSINRMRDNAKSAYDKNFDDEKYQIIHRPLVCIGTSNSTIDSIKDFDETKLNIGFIDTLDMQSSDHHKTYLLNGLKHSTEYDKYLNKNIENYKNA